MISKLQRKPFCLATLLYAHNDWLGGNFVLTFDVFAYASMSVRLVIAFLHELQLRNCFVVFCLNSLSCSVVTYCFFLGDALSRFPCFRGACGEVKLAFEKGTRHKVAVKILSKKTFSFQNEVIVMCHFSFSPVVWNQERTREEESKNVSFNRHQQSKNVKATWCTITSEVLVCTPVGCLLA